MKFAIFGLSASVDISIVNRKRDGYERKLILLLEVIQTHFCKYLIRRVHNSFFSFFSFLEL